MNLAQKIALTAIRTGFRVLDRLAPATAAKWAIDLFTTPRERVLVPLSDFFQEAEEEQLEVEGLKIKGFRWRRERGRRAMVLHGFESSVTNFEAYARKLYEAGFEVLAFDGPSSGRSEGTKLTPINYAKLIGTVLDRYGPVHAFAAHSFGAMALGLALESSPHNLPDQRIAIIAGMTETSTAATQFFDQLSIGRSVQKAFFKQIISMTGNELSWYSLNRIVPKLKGELCWFHDKEDTDTPLTDLDPLRFSVQPSVQFYITEGLGHRQIYKEEFIQNEVISFLHRYPFSDAEHKITV